MEARLSPLAHLAPAGFFVKKERSVDGEPPNARGAVQGIRDRASRGDPGLRRRRRAHLSGEDRQDAVPGAARGAGGFAEALKRDGGTGSPGPSLPDVGTRPTYAPVCALTHRSSRPPS